MNDYTTANQIITEETLLNDLYATEKELRERADRLKASPCKTLQLTEDGYKAFCGVIAHDRPVYQNALMTDVNAFADNAEKIPGVTCPKVYAVTVYIDTALSESLKVGQVFRGRVMEYKGALYHICPCTNGKCRFFIFNDGSDYKKTKHVWGGLKEPNKVGVPTAKKIEDWANYLKKRYELHASEMDRMQNKVSEFLKMVQATFVGDPDCTLDLNPNRGRVTKNNLVYTYEISESGQIYQRVDIAKSVYGDDAIATFKAMTEGKA